MKCKMSRNYVIKKPKSLNFQYLKMESTCFHSDNLMAKRRFEIIQARLRYHKHWTRFHHWYVLLLNKQHKFTSEKPSSRNRESLIWLSPPQIHFYSPFYTWINYILRGSFLKHKGIFLLYAKIEQVLIKANRVR